MVMFMLVSAFAKPQEEWVEDPNDPLVIERNVRQSCSEAKNVEEAYLMMGLTTAFAQGMVDTLLPVTNASSAAYPDAAFELYGERLSYNDREYILVQVGEINSHMLAAWSTLERQIRISVTASNELAQWPQRRLHRDKRRVVVETCTRDRFQIILAIGAVGDAATQMKADLDALDAEIATRVAVRQ